MSSATLPPPESISLLRRWQYYYSPQFFAAELFKRLGPLAHIRFMGADYAMVLTAEGARQVFAQAPDNYEVFWRESFVGTHGENNLWVMTGKAHRYERKLFAPAVHPGHIRAKGEVIHDIARDHFARWQAGKTATAFDTTKAISLDVIMRLVFGVEDEDVMDEGRRVLDRLSRTAKPIIIFYPGLQRWWFPPWRRWTRAKADVYEWAGRLIALRRSRGTIGDDVLGCLMSASDEDGRPYTQLHICNELLAILSAGHLTTGVALSWVLYEVGRDPAVQAKLRAELEAAGPDLRAQDLLSLPYLSAVCNETIRLHPILAECGRIPREPIDIINHTIPANHGIILSIVNIHHDPEVYPEPERFLPERFLHRTYAKTEFMPFGGGHRRCLGAALAEYTLRIGLAEAIMRWDYEIAREDCDTRDDLAMGPKHGVPLRVLRPYKPLARTEQSPADRPKNDALSLVG
jgi:cytochrome P450